MGARGGPRNVLGQLHGGEADISAMLLLDPSFSLCCNIHPSPLAFFGSFLIQSLDCIARVRLFQPLRTSLRRFSPRIPASESQWTISKEQHHICSCIKHTCSLCIEAVVINPESNRLCPCTSARVPITNTHRRWAACVYVFPYTD